jgi:hypothetical protein
MADLMCRFRLQFVRPAARLAILASVLLELLIWMDGARDHAAWLVARLFLVLVCALFMGLMVLLCGVRVTLTGLRCPGWRELAWERMSTVHSCNLLGFRFLVIYPEGASFGVWLPLFLRNLDQLRSVVEACVASSHPLRVSLTTSSAKQGTDRQVQKGTA